MKKIVALVLALILCLAATSALAEKYGLAVLTDWASVSAPATVDGETKNGAAELDTTICMLILNDDNTIKYVKFDVAQTTMGITAEGALVGRYNPAPIAAGDTVLSKEAKKDGYGMRGASSIGKEWFEQIAALEAFCVGKTVEEVVAMPLGPNDHYPDVETTPADPDLKTATTIQVVDFLNALQEAYNLATAE